MHKTRPAQITSPVVSLNGGQVKAIPTAAVAGLIGIGLAFGLSLVGGFENGLKRFLMTYLASYCFVLSIGVGCLFFVYDHAFDSSRMECHHSPDRGNLRDVLATDVHLVLANFDYAVDGIRCRL